MDVYNKKGWMQPMGILPSSLRTYGEIFGNVWVNEANTLNTTDLPKNLSEIKAEWDSYDLLGNHDYKIKIYDSPIRDLIKVGIKYGQIVEGGPHVWYYVFKRIDMEHVQFIVSPWYVKKYNDLKDTTMTSSQITKKCSEYAAQQLATQQLAAQQQELADEDPVAGLDAILDNLKLRTESHAGPETLSDRRAATSDTILKVVLPAHTGEAAARAASAVLAGTGIAAESPSGEMYGSMGGGRKRRYTKKIKRRSSKKRRSKKRRSKKRRSKKRRSRR
jgi:hypothetical protein